MYDASTNPILIPMDLTINLIISHSNNILYKYDLQLPFICHQALQASKRWSISVLNLAHPLSNLMIQNQFVLH